MASYVHSFSRASFQRQFINPQLFCLVMEAMSSPTRTSALDLNTIDISEQYERRAWARSFGITEEMLIEVVRKFGPSADRVRTYLRSRANA
jgi:hypothetical protein